MSIMKGAILYVMNSSKIVSRKSPYTIGTSISSTKIEGTECRRNELDKCEYFNTFFRKEEDIDNNKEIT